MVTVGSGMEASDEEEYSVNQIDGDSDMTQN